MGGVIELSRRWHTIVRYLYMNEQESHSEVFRSGCTLGIGWRMDIISTL